MPFFFSFSLQQPSILIPYQYDCLVFDGIEHVRIANLPGMWDRTITVGSAGSKHTFSPLGTTILIYHFTEAFAATGWRIGWLIAPASYIGPTLAASTRIVFCTNSPLQEAAAAGLEQAKEKRFFENQLAEYQERRSILSDAFDKLGLKYSLPQGTYFVLLVKLLLERKLLFDLNGILGYLASQLPRGLSLPTNCSRERTGLQVSLIYWSGWHF